jgi:hypothetical protein
MPPDSLDLLRLRIPVIKMDGKGKKNGCVKLSLSDKESHRRMDGGMYLIGLQGSSNLGRGIIFIFLCELPGHLELVAIFRKLAPISVHF